MASIDDYVALIPSANRSQPNFLAVLAATIQPGVDNLNLLASFPMLHDVDTANGDALDGIGDWVGIKRTLKVAIAGVYFSFDTVGVGFDQGVWYNSSLPLTGVVELDDETYRDMVKVKIAANIWDGSMGMANAALVDIFGSQGDPPVVWYTDNFNMTGNIHITGAPHSALLDQLVRNGYMPFKPEGVAITFS